MRAAPALDSQIVTCFWARVDGELLALLEEAVLPVLVVHEVAEKAVVLECEIQGEAGRPAGLCVRVTGLKVSRAHGGRRGGGGGSGHAAVSAGCRRRGGGMPPAAARRCGTARG